MGSVLRGAAAAVVVYDITSRESFEGAKRWVNELRSSHNPDVVIGRAHDSGLPRLFPIAAFCGNKSDLAEEREVPTQRGAEYAQENNLLFVETSAKTGANVHHVFVEIGRTSQSSSILFVSGSQRSFCHTSRSKMRLKRARSR